MTRFTVLASVLLLALSVSAFGQTLDPVGFCPPPGSVSACTTATASDHETISISGSSFVMMKNGNGGTAIDPWYLLVAVPEDLSGDPTLTTSDFNVSTQTGKDLGTFTPSSGDIYRSEEHTS